MVSGVPGQAHAVGDELAGDGDPVDVRAGGQMRAEGAGRAVDLAQVLLVLDVPQLTVQTVDVDGELLAERGRCGRLAVGEGEQGLVLVFLGLGGEVVDDLLERRRPYLLHRVLHATGDGQVVDVFGRAGEVHEGLQLVVDVGQLGRSLVDLIIDVVLHGLHIVVGDGLMSGVLLDAFGAEVLGNGAQEGLLLRRVNGLTPSTIGWLPLPSKPLARRIIHSTSTRTRSRFRAGSLMYSTSGAVAL